MNTIHNNGKTDETLQDDLDRVGRAYGQLEQTHPPDLVDQAILNSAHRAIDKKPHWMKFGWLHGLTTVAIFGLAISLILKQPETAPVVNETINLNGNTLLQQDHVTLQPQVGKSAVEARKKMETTEIAPVAGAESMATAHSADTEGMAMEPESTLPAPAEKTAESNRAGANFVEEFKDSRVDADNEEFVGEQVASDEADSAPRAVTRQLKQAQPAPAAIMEPVAKESKDLAEDEINIEQQLRAIIRLKEAGDDTWETELARFKQDYPDYPIPEELKS